MSQILILYFGLVIWFSIIRLDEHIWRALTKNQTTVRANSIRHIRPGLYTVEIAFERLFSKYQCARPNQGTAFVSLSSCLIFPRPTFSLSLSLSQTGLFEVYFCSSICYFVSGVWLRIYETLRLKRSTLVYLLRKVISVFTSKNFLLQQLYFVLSLPKVDFTGFT